jgi:predicted secreted protein
LFAVGVVAGVAGRHTTSSALTLHLMTHTVPIFSVQAVQRMVWWRNLLSARVRKAVINVKNKRMAWLGTLASIPKSPHMSLILHKFLSSCILGFVVDPTFS